MVLLLCSSPAHAQVSGAIFTTLPDGSAVNFNIYPSKDSVYLDGGPPPGAPQTAAGLPNGTYVFQVTDPSGKALLSQDIANCRQFTVANGIITGVVNVGACTHKTGLDIDHGATTVQLMPYLDTPNNGGEYKAWATPLQDYLDGCDALGVANGLGVVDCGYTGGDDHGFVPRFSKTDNFKVNQNAANREIDTHFFDARQNETPGLCETWTDSLGVLNPRCSLVDLTINDNGFAHVENVENGIHTFTFTNQPGCTVGLITLNLPNGTQYFNGPQTITVKVTPGWKSGTIAIWVQCQ
jgi:hypothetical protein